MREDERGTILIEFVGSFLMFVLLVISVLSLVNIATMQARIHYALTQAAQTISMYGYVLNVIGVDEFMMKSDEAAEEVREGANASINDINAVLDSINELDVPGVVKNTETAATNIGGQLDNAFENPKGAVQKLANYGLREVESATFEEMLRPLIEYHLVNGDMSGGDYLLSVGVDGADSLEFHSWESAIPGYSPPAEGGTVGSINEIPNDNSVLLNSDGNIKITVQYEMAYSFMGLNRLLPFGPKLKVTQSVMTKMWLGGEGEGYKSED